MITLLSQNDDPNTTRLASSLGAQGQEVQVVLFGQPRDTFELSGDLQDPVLRVDGTALSKATFGGPNRGVLMRVGLNPQTYLAGEPSQFSTREWEALIGGLIAGWEIESSHRWLLGLRNYRLKDSKIALLQAAIRLGAPVPPTFVSSRLRAEDLAGRQWVAKGINAWEEIVPGTFFNTHLLSEAEIHELLDLPVLEGPLLLQQYVRHEVELRAYFAAGEKFAVEIRATDPSIVDFRLHDGTTANAGVVDVPAGVERLATRLMDEFDLRYCVFDVLCDISGDYWLVDINPLGVWDYLEDDFGLVLTENISKGILNL